MARGYGSIPNPTYVGSLTKYNTIAGGQTPDGSKKGFAFNRESDYLCGAYQGPLPGCWPSGVLA